MVAVFIISVMLITFIGLYSEVEKGIGRIYIVNLGYWVCAFTQIELQTLALGGLLLVYSLIIGVAILDYKN